MIKKIQEGQEINMVPTLKGIQGKGKEW